MEQYACIGELTQDLDQWESGHELRIFIEGLLTFLARDEYQLKVPRKVTHQKEAKKKTCQGHCVFLC